MPSQLGPQKDIVTPGGGTAVSECCLRGTCVLAPGCWVAGVLSVPRPWGHPQSTSALPPSPVGIERPCWAACQDRELACPRVLGPLRSQPL